MFIIGSNAWSSFTASSDFWVNLVSGDKTDKTPEELEAFLANLGKSPNGNPNDSGRDPFAAREPAEQQK